MLNELMVPSIPLGGSNDKAVKLKTQWRRLLTEQILNTLIDAIKHSLQVAKVYFIYNSFFINLQLCVFSIGALWNKGSTQSHVSDPNPPKTVLNTFQLGLLVSRRVSGSAHFRIELSIVLLVSWMFPRSCRLEWFQWRAQGKTPWL